jgi:hypothetical protein
MKSKSFRLVDRFAAGLGLLVLIFLTGCADTPPWGSMSVVPTSAQLQAVRGRQSSYVYYSAYEIYYESSGREYTFREGEDWVTRWSC